MIITTGKTVSIQVPGNVAACVLRMVPDKSRLPSLFGLYWLSMAWSYPESAEPILASLDAQKIERTVKRERKMNPGVAFFECGGVFIEQEFDSKGDPTGKFSFTVTGKDGDDIVFSLQP